MGRASSPQRGMPIRDPCSPRRNPSSRRSHPSSHTRSATSRASSGGSSSSWRRSWLLVGSSGSSASDGLHALGSARSTDEQTRARGDYGADLVLEKDGARAVVQAKRWSRNVGVKAVQEAVAAKPLYRCDYSMVVTNRYFTEQARRLAKANDVRLWNRDDLVGALLANTDEGLPPAVSSTSG